MTTVVGEVWFYGKAGQQFGPVSFESLARLVRSGQLDPQDLVWKAGMQSWVPVSTVPQLSAPDVSAAWACPNAAVGASHPHAPQHLEYYTPQNQTALYAGFWLRFCAAFLDGIITTVGAMIAGAVLGAVIGLSLGLQGASVQSIEAAASVAGQLVGLLVGWLYSAFMESSSQQATLGKMAVGIKVTGLDGGRISFGRATGRHFAKIISGLILLIGYIMAAFTARKQALHDVMASTLVVRK